MPNIDVRNRLINCKITYYGTGLGGKTTNIQYIHNKIDPSYKGKLVSLATKTERTLFFDFMPLSLGRIKGFKVTFNICTVPGQSFYNNSRKLLLKGTDGIVFVADSQEHRFDANIDSLYNLQENLEEYNVKLENVPLVIQYNKRDLPNVLPVQELRAELNLYGVPDHEAVAVRGTGVFETLRSVIRLVSEDIRKRL
ncbi:MAG TPA: GTPase domain-containing protein [Candidatus Brocadiia bacterium]|nr:GTPase domain-containing protein [Candidatus Brocadiia bacterium]